MEWLLDKRGDRLTERRDLGLIAVFTSSLPSSDGAGGRRVPSDFG